MRKASFADMHCSIAQSLEIVGEWWTLLILRDCFRGVRRFEAFQERLGITRHILAERLRRLVEAGVLTRVRYQESPVRCEYRLTDKGKALHPVLVTLIAWAEEAVPSDAPSSLRLVFSDTGAPVRPIVVDEVTGERITHRNVRGER